MSDSEKKVVLITGANRGFGFSISKVLTQEGYLVVNGIRDKKCKIENSVHIEMTDTDEIKKTVQRVIDKFSRIDILINNAGVYLDDPRIGYGDIMALEQDILEYTFISAKSRSNNGKTLTLYFFPTINSLPYSSKGFIKSIPGIV